jgi:hypothetical protein
VGGLADLEHTPLSVFAWAHARGTSAPKDHVVTGDNGGHMHLYRLMERDEVRRAERERERRPGLAQEVETPLPSNSPHDHMILRVEQVDSHRRWKRPCLQTAHMTI